MYATAGQHIQAQSGLPAPSARQPSTEAALLNNRLYSPEMNKNLIELGTVRLTCKVGVQYQVVHRAHKLKQAQPQQVS